MNQLGKIKQLMGLLTENSKPNGYGCIMLYVKFPEFKDIQSKISEDDLYAKKDDGSFGFESDPHVTILYGLHKEVSTHQVKDIIDKIKFTPIVICKASIFENDGFDVLKFGIESNNSLNNANKEASKLPNSNEFPVFRPHLTLAYLKKGEGTKYIKLLSGTKYELQPIHIVFSEMNGKQNIINIAK